MTLVDAAIGGRPWADAARYLPAQVVGCISGTVLANLMFGLAPVALSSTERVTPSHLLAEVVATAGLVLVIFALVRTDRPSLAAPAVGAYIGAAYFFTSSSSFANPAITVGRMFSDTFAGIAPASVAPYVAAQLVGGVLGALLVLALYPRRTEPAPAITPTRVG